MRSFLSIKNWNKTFLYFLFVFSTFSIAGMDASICILYLTSLISLIKNRQITNLNLPLFWAILFFMIFSVLSGLLNEYQTDHVMAIRTNWRLILPLIVALILKDVDEQRLLYVFFLFVMLVAAYGIIQFFTGADWLRPESQSFTTPYKPISSINNIVFHGKGNFSHHLTFGGYLLICSSILISLIFCRDLNSFTRTLTIFISIIVLLGITSSLGRSIWLGTIITIAILLFRLSPKIMLCITICFFIFGSYLYIQINNSNLEISKSSSRLELVQKRIISSFKIKSNKDRILMWKAGLEAIKDHFWLGIGFNNDKDIMQSYREKISKRTGHKFWNNASTGVHNIYLQTWINYGVLGLILYLSIFVIFLAQILITIPKTRRFSYENSILWAGLAGVCGFMVAGFFENNFRDGEVQVMLLILMGLCLHQIQKIKKRIF